MSIVVIDGSGRLADTIAKYVKMRREYYAGPSLMRGASSKSLVSSADGNASTASPSARARELASLPEEESSSSQHPEGEGQAAHGESEHASNAAS